ncbi:MAG: DUF6776 family protein [Pseudomonadota bacterium]|nr:DUF6776 family protein [Pseudomonadota bacterium]
MFNIFYRQPSSSKAKPGPSVLKVKQHHPWLCPLLIASAIGATGWLGIFFCHRNTQSLEHNWRLMLERNRQDLEEIHQDNVSLIAQNNELREKLLTLVETTQNDQDHYAKLLHSLEALENESDNLKKAVEFYHTLLTMPKADSTQIAIQEFIVHHTEQQHHYRFQLILTQRSKKPETQSGQIQLELIGQQANQHKRLAMQAITAEHMTHLKYEVDYFQIIKGQLQLPEQFIPERIIVNILPKGSSSARQATFRWQDLYKEQP